MASVFIKDISDYINPSQACINPLFTASTPHDDKEGKANKSVTNTINSTLQESVNEKELKSSSIHRNRRRRRRIQIGHTDIIENSSTVTENNDLLLDENGIINPNNLDENQNLVPVATKTTTTTTTKPSSKATISVADCLACSGCITSSEAVLVTQHSIDTLKEQCSMVTNYNHVHNNPKQKVIVFTISPASIADLTRILYQINDNDSNIHNNKIPPIDFMMRTYRKLASFLHQKFNASIVLDGIIPQRISLMESAIEFVHRYRVYHQFSSSITTSKSTASLSYPIQTLYTTNINTPPNSTKDIRINFNTPSIALSATKTKFIFPNSSKSNNSSHVDDLIIHEHDGGIDSRLSWFFHPTPPTSSTLESSLYTPTPQDYSYNQPTSHVLPMLSSSCPGFVCYVEKTHSKVIPNLSTVKSPMAIAGSLFKHSISSSSSSSSKEETIRRMNEDIYHVAIMPCHDKKLEAGRNDLAWERIMYNYQNNLVFHNTSNNNDTERSQQNQNDLLHDIDLVITTQELLNVIHDEAQLWFQGEKNHDDRVYENVPNEHVDDNLLSMYINTLPLAPVKKWSHHESITNNYCYTSTYKNTSDKDFHLMSNFNSTGGYKNNGIPNEIKESVSSPSPRTSTTTASTTTSKMSKQITSEPNTMFIHGSGSYADFIFRYAAKALFNHVIPDSQPLPWKKVLNKGSSSGNGAAISRRRRNLNSSTNTNNNVSDFCEVMLYRHDDGSFSCNPKTNQCNETIGSENDGVLKNDEVVLRFATSYGFKNVQLLLQQLSRRSSMSCSDTAGNPAENTRPLYDYVEVMACPSGCLNGGGQIKEENRGVLNSDKELLNHDITNSSDTSHLIVRETPSQIRARVQFNESFIRIPFSTHTDNEDNTPIKGYDENNHHVSTIDGEFLKHHASLKEYHTRFHVVPELELTTGATAGVALQDTKW